MALFYQKTFILLSKKEKTPAFAEVLRLLFVGLLLGLRPELPLSSKAL